MSIAGKWGFSRDGETYTGAFDTREEAIAEGGETAKFVGRYREPCCEDVIEASDVLDKILCQDDYCGDWAEDALSATIGQLGELTVELQKVVGQWLDKHDLRPTFGIVERGELIEKGEEE